MRHDSWFPRPSLLIAAVVLAVAGGGCAGRPPPPVPAMAALSATGDYGYSETALAPDLYVVTFVSPSLSAHGDPDQEYGLGGEKQRARDLALWRAAQLAQEKKYPAFEVQHESRDVDVTVRHDPIYPAYPPPFFFGRCRWDCDWPFGFWPYDYGYPTYRTRAAGRIAVNLTVKLLAKATADSLDTAATIERLRKAYGSATFALTAAD